MKKRPPETLRIIGGRWRRRHISFPDIPGLRPTQDRVRETLFNWLAPNIVGAFCLDLFAGSGALGFEALSRGAKQVSFVDNHKAAITAIEANAKKLEAENIEILRGECPDRIPALSFAPYDIVFLDPPFHQSLLASTAKWLEQSGYLNDEAYIYVETEKGSARLPVPSNWSIKKNVETASMRYFLCFRQRDPAIRSSGQAAGAG